AKVKYLKKRDLIALANRRRMRNSKTAALMSHLLLNSRVMPMRGEVGPGSTATRPTHLKSQGELHGIAIHEEGQEGRGMEPDQFVDCRSGFDHGHRRLAACAGSEVATLDRPPHRTHPGAAGERQVPRRGSRRLFRLPLATAGTKA